RRILMGEPDLDGVPESLLGPVTQCLSKDPTDRPTSERLSAALLGYDTGSRPAADEAIQRGETLTAQSGRLSLPPMTIMGDSDTTGYAHDPGPVPRTTPPAAGWGTGPGTGRPFSFGDRPMYTPEELAEAMQLDWDATTALQRSAPQRRSLQRWLPDDHPAQ